MDLTLEVVTNCLLLCQTGCPGDYDVIVMLDRSRDVSGNQYVRFEQHIKDILHLFEIGQDKTHFGLLLFNNRAKVSLKTSLLSFQNVHRRLFVLMEV